MITYSIIKKSELEGAYRIDAEYYQPRYLKINKVLKNMPYKRFSEVISNIINGDEIREYVNENGLPYLRVSDIKEFFIDLSSVVYISKDSKIKQNIKLKERDILLSRSGSLGISAVSTPDLSNAVISSHLMRITTKNINPYFLVAFLNSKFGINQIMQKSNGAVVPEINHPSLKEILVPFFSENKQKEIEKVVRISYKKIQESNRIYLQAEQMLLDELKLNNFDFSQPNHYTVNLSQAQGVKRIDAEHFQPKYVKLIQHLTKTGKTKLLGEIASYIKRGLQPTYVEEGEVLVFTEKHLGRSLLNIEFAETTDTTFWERNKQARVEKNNILLYSIGAYIGRANCYLDDKKAITSSNVTIIKINENIANPIYVSVFLNSIAGKMQAEKWTASVGQMALYPSDVPKFIIYLPSEEFQNKIAELVIQSYEARKRAKQLLNEAKQKVEKIILNN